jgi:capsular exopolysaccharide synthesis family protein
MKLADLRRQLAELTASYTPAYYKVQRVQAQVTELEATLARERANVINRIRNEYDSAQRRERLLAAAYAAQAKLVSAQAAKAIHYNILKREVDTTRQLHEAMLQKVKEAGIASAMRASNIRVVDAATVPTRPFKPNLLLNSALGLFSGVFLGVVLVLARERTDLTLRAPGDTLSCLPLPELGVIPAASADGSQRALVWRAGRSGTERPGEQVELATWKRKPSLLAESFRATLTSILFCGHNGDRPRILVLTSPSPAEGKTTVVSNLGIALAEIHRRVLLIDADLRRPRLHQVFGLPNDRGLGHLLVDGCSPGERPGDPPIQETEIERLYLLPSGSGASGATNLLHSDRMRTLLRQFRRDFDVVLIDSPPMLQIADARVLGRLADGVILVFRSGETSRSAALAACRRFAEDGTRVLGTVLNAWDPDSTGYGYYRSHDYHRYYHSSGPR